MISVNDYVIVENREEFEEYLHPFDKHIFDGAVLPAGFNIEEVSFPLALRYCYPYNSGCMGSWAIVTLDKAKKEMVKMLKKEINERAKILEIIEKNY